MGGGMSAENNSPAALYAEREARVRDAIELREPDRVPIFLYSTFWQALDAGMTCEQAMYDYDRLGEAARRSVLELEPDAYVLPHFMLALGPTMEIMDYRQLQWPGHNGVDPNVSFQYLDKEYMKADEYDDYLLDPTGFYLKKYLPRVAGVYEAFRKLPDFPGLFYTRVVHSTAAYDDPDVRQAFETLARAGAEMRTMLGKAMALAKELAESGFPLAISASGGAPFDLLADYLRGSKGAMLDMFRNKDKLLAAMDKAAQFIPRAMIDSASRSPCKTVFIPLHWGLDGFMSPEQFETFFWPSLRKVVMTLIEAGLTPCLLWEGDCTSRLEVIRDVPPGKCIYFFERTDMFKAKEVLGDVVCLRGNVPASMMTTGTPDEVRDYCKKLIDVCGDGGGFIMDCGIGIPDESKRENVLAMFETTREYGVYR